MKKEIIVSGSFYSPVYEKVITVIQTWVLTNTGYVLKKVSINGKERICGGENEI